MTRRRASFVELESPLAPAACRQRLERAAAGDSTEAHEVFDEMAITLDGIRFTVVSASADGDWRAFRRLLFGEIVNARGGTIVRGQFRLHRAARVALVAWFGSMAMVVALLVTAWVTGAGEAIAGPTGWAMVALPVAMLAAAGWLVRWSMGQSRPSEAAVIEYVARLLEARPVANARG